MFAHVGPWLFFFSARGIFSGPHSLPLVPAVACGRSASQKGDTKPHSIRKNHVSLLDTKVLVTNSIAYELGANKTL